MIQGHQPQTQEQIKAVLDYAVQAGVPAASSNGSGELAYTAADVRSVLLHVEGAVLERLPSRRPARSDLLAALRSMRTSTGRSNKTRAAAYLGWDVDTLVARLRDAGIGAETGCDEAGWLPLGGEPT